MKINPSLNLCYHFFKRCACHIFIFFWFCLRCSRTEINEVYLIYDLCKNLPVIIIESDRIQFGATLFEVFNLCKIIYKQRNFKNRNR